MYDYLQRINECRGRIIIDQEDDRVQMLLAWLLYRSDLINKNIYTVNKRRTMGLWTKVMSCSSVRHDDLLILTAERECNNDLNVLIICIDKVMTHKDVMELEQAIEAEHARAYKPIDNYSVSYFESVSYMPALYYKDNLLCNRDYRSENVNIINGLRYTHTNPVLVQNNVIHFFGDSRMYGLYVSDENTIPSLVSKKTGQKCINYGTHGTSILDIRLQIKNAKLNYGDIVVINNGFIKSNKELAQSLVDMVVVDEILKIKEVCREKGVSLIMCMLPNCGNKKSLSPQELNICIFQELQKNEPANSKYYSLDANWEELMMELQLYGIPYCDVISNIQYQEDADMFVDFIHFGTVGNDYISNILSDYINKVNEKLNRIDTHKQQIDEVKQGYMQIICERRGDKKSIFFDSQKFNRFIELLQASSYGKPDGAAVIVMNANPFTYGHLYIIEEALKRYPYLYVLVVQEKDTVVPFDDRLELLKKGTAHLNNISIIPSSEFVVSNITLPEYFNKENNQISHVDASRDIDLFINHIMPALGVDTRIAGAEPYCKITREYNRQIQNCFEDNSLSFVQIERKKQNDIYISASKVRSAVYNGIIETIKDMVPTTTYEYLLNNGEMLKERMKLREVTQ